MDAYPVRTSARPRGRRLLKAALAAVASLSLAFAGVALESFAPSAVAAPTVVAGPGTINAPTVGPLGVGAYSGTVPAGICSVTATVVGGAGGSAVTTTTNANGAGASITATYPVVAGWTYGGTVGGGGGRPTGSGSSDTAGPGGSNGGGTGGTSGAVSNIKHHGAGGGGYTDLSFNGSLAILAGGGGGAGGGHSTGTDGTGGNAGLPTGSGVANGQNGFKGKDYPNATTVTGGTGGSATAGAGGTNSQLAAANGFAGTLRVGGTGGNDTNPDAGGGGGGGYAGGGGGASTKTYNTEFGAPDGEQIAGAGGGGGSSYVAPSTTAGNVSGLSSALGAKITTATSAAGANGSLTLTWNACTYDLGVTKSVAQTSGNTVTWTVAVTNNGPSPMTQGDTVTITDDLPGAGTKTVTGISTSGGSNTLMANGAITCGTVTVGSTLTGPATIDCSRPHQPVGGSVNGVRGLNVGETLTLTYTQPISATVTDTVGVTDRPTTAANNSASATITPPAAVNDSSLGNALYAPVTLNVVTNDTGTFGANPVTLWNTTTSAVIASPYVVAGQGTWTVSGSSVTFTPLASFKGDPTPVTYRVTASNGLTATATVTITYLPVAVNDSRSNLVIGTATTLQPLTNDDGDWTVSSLRLMNGATAQTSLTVAGQGVWTISGADVTFTPQSGFASDPTPVTYRITDSTGDNVTATITLNYVPGAADDSSLNNALGTTVNLSVLANDTGSFTASTLQFVANGGTTLAVPGEGTWTVQPGGVIRFVPDSGFYGDPAPVSYRVTDTTGDQVTATVTVTYLPAAVNDSSTGHALGTVVDVSVVANDQGSFTAGSVRLMNGINPVTTLNVPGEGTWTVEAGDVIRFTPLSTFLGDPAPAYYRVTDTTGDNVSATVTVGYVPAAADDAQGGLAIGSTATVPVLANDTGDWVTSSLRLIHPTTGSPVTSVTVAGEGTWTISGANAVFTPLPTFLLDPAPLGYRITDSTGDTVSATITLDYGPGALDDSSLDNALGTVVSLNVLTNDTGSFDTATLGFGPGNIGVGAILPVVGEGSWEVVSAGVIRFTPDGAFLGDPTPVRYYVDDINGDQTGALMTITYLPAASDDSDLGNAFGTDVNVAVLANDQGDFVANSVRILDGTTPVLSLNVSGEGTWIAEADGTVTFHPDSGFLTDPAPVRYRVTDSTGDDVDAQVTVTYLPLAVDDAQGGLSIGSVATVPVLTNDQGDWVTSSLRLIHPVSGSAVTSVTIAGQGTWTISGADAVFTPQSGFLVDPDPIDYRITDSTGDTVVATVTLDYGPGAADDADLGNALGTAVDVDVFDNDSGSFDASTLGFGAGTGVGTQLIVAGEGTWEVLAGGIVRFTPEPGFYRDPTSVRYYADDVTGDPADALITITYLPIAADDSDLDNAFGSSVNVDALANDTGDFVAGTVRLLDGTTPVTVLPVAGEGTWTVQGDDTITFAPLSTFLVDPSDVDYQVTDVTGDVVSATVHVTYLPLAVDDDRTGLAIGAVATVPVLTNDHGSFTNSTLRLVNPVGGASVTSVTVPGQGAWTLSGTNVVFTPQSGFLVDPDAIDYRITDVTGDTTSATVTLDYVPAAVDDSDLGNALGTAVDLDVLANDHGSFDLATLGFGPGNVGVGATRVVLGQGTWEVIAGGVIRFTPLASFLTDPTPVRYDVSDVTGDPVDALMTITYLPEAADDSDLGNTMGTAVNVDVLANDTGDFSAGTVRLMDGLLPVMTLAVSGEGGWAVESDDTITFTPEPGFLTDPGVVHYRVIDSTGDAVSATITVTYLPQATNNSSTGHAAGTTVNVDVLGNDSGSFVANSVRLIDPGTGNPVLTVTVAGEGDWRANADGTITFVPAAGYFADPTPIDYEVTDVTGDRVRAQLRLAFLPVAALNQSNGNAFGSPAVIDPLANDTGTFDATTVRLIDPGTGTPVTSVVVPGEGTWDVDTTTGIVTFTPEPGFMGNPTTITYEVTDVTGDVVQATITVTYLPEAVDDEKLNNKGGDPVTVSVLPNDLGTFAVSSARLMSGSTPMMALTVPGQGTWRMNASVAQVTFTPQAGFLGNPAPVPYRVADVNGNLATANVTITYLHTTGLAYTGMEAGTQLLAGLGAIALGLLGVAIARVRRITARHRA